MSVKSSVTVPLIAICIIVMLGVSSFSTTSYVPLPLSTSSSIGFSGEPANATADIMNISAADANPVSTCFIDFLPEARCPYMKSGARLPPSYVVFAVTGHGIQPVACDTHRAAASQYGIPQEV